MPRQPRKLAPKPAPVTRVPRIRTGTLAAWMPATTATTPNAVASTPKVRFSRAPAVRRTSTETAPATIRAVTTAPPVSGARLPVAAATTEGTSDR